MEMNEKLVDALIKKLEIRKQQLESQAQEKRGGYRIHEGHHMRDTLTVLAVLKDEPNAEQLVKNMPTEEDL